MHFTRHRAPARGRGRQLLAVLVLATACSRPPAADRAPPSGEWHRFDGTWTASGTRRPLRLGPDRQAWTSQLSGTVLLTGQGGMGVGFRAEVIGLADTRTGFVGRCVWTDQRGDQIYSELAEEPLGGEISIVGTFVGGTGRWAGVTGDYRFRWQYLIDGEDGAVTGRATGLEGRARIGSPGSRPTGGSAR